MAYINRKCLSKYGEELKQLHILQV